MRVIRARDLEATPWKNGGGETREMAVFPEGAGLDDFDGRVSMASVASDGPFSLFPGIDRTLVILEGAGLRLTIGDRAPVLLTRESPPFDFAGDGPASAELVAGPIVDLNVMTRRDRRLRRVTRLDLGARPPLAMRAQVGLLFCAQGFARMETPGGEVILGPRDALLGCGDDTVWRLGAGSSGRAFLIEIENVGPNTA